MSKKGLSFTKFSVSWDSGYRLYRSLYSRICKILRNKTYGNKIPAKYLKQSEDLFFRIIKESNYRIIVHTPNSNGFKLWVNFLNGCSIDNRDGLNPYRKYLFPILFYILNKEIYDIHRHVENKFHKFSWINMYEYTVKKFTNSFVEKSVIDYLLESVLEENPKAFTKKEVEKYSKYTDAKNCKLKVKLNTANFYYDEKYLNYETCAILEHLKDGWEIDFKIIIRFDNYGEPLGLFHNDMFSQILKDKRYNGMFKVGVYSNYVRFLSFRKSSRSPDSKQFGPISEILEQEKLIKEGILVVNLDAERHSKEYLEEIKNSGFEKYTKWKKTTKEIIKKKIKKVTKNNLT